ncbi:MAG: class I SAM-dependent methyltransferase, partial [Hyphomicrobiaceae bacterium]
DMARLFLKDAEAEREGLYPPTEDEASGFADRLMRVRHMLADLPDVIERREAADAQSARAAPEAGDLPAYYTQDFHFQSGGYLTERSARLYDVQVETLFMGSANVMRRAGLRPIAEFIKGRDQRGLALLDVACGTGRFLRQVRLAFPALRLTGLDLSKVYLDEAENHMRGLRPAAFVPGNAENMPFADASQDIVSTIFLYHELPPEVRRHVSRQIARVLKPGGLFVFIDSLQTGDKPAWDGLLEAFPERFHEPYYRHYAGDDLDGMFAAAGLERSSVGLAFMSKTMVRRKTVTSPAEPG